MSRFQPTPGHSLTRCAAAARAINANCIPSPRGLAAVIAATVEIEGKKPEIIIRDGKYGVPYLVRSAIAPTCCYPDN